MNNINVEISFEEMLTDQVQKYKILYDKSASRFKNALTKSMIWKIVAEQTSVYRYLLFNYENNILKQLNILNSLFYTSQSTNVFKNGTLCEIDFAEKLQNKTLLQGAKHLLQRNGSFPEINVLKRTYTNKERVNTHFNFTYQRLNDNLYSKFFFTVLKAILQIIIVSMKMLMLQLDENTLNLSGIS